MAFLPFQIGAIVPKRMFGPFDTYLTVEEVTTDDLEITQHPVQDGAAITDHAYRKPTSITTKIMFNDELAPLTEIYQRLLDLKDSRVLMDVVTGTKAYKNMLIRGIVHTKDQITNAVLALSVEFQEVIIVSVEKAKVPERAKQAKKDKTPATENAGAKSPVEQDVSIFGNKSIAATLAGL